MGTTVRNLQWTASANKSWITVSPTAGTGNANVTITATPSTTVGERDIEGTVVFRCEGMERIYTVRRCVPTECEVDTVTTTYTDVTANVSACDKQVSVDVPYTKTTTYKNNCRESEVENGTAATTYTFDVNDTLSVKTHTFYYPDQSTNPHATITVSQAAGPCNPTTCQCEDLEVFEVSPLPCDGGTYTIATYTPTSAEQSRTACLFIWTVSEGAGVQSWIYNTGWIAKDGQIKANVMPNTEKTDRTTTVYIKYSTNVDGVQTQCEDKQVKVTQSACEIQCSCDDLTIPVTEISIEKDESSDVSITSAECITNIQVVSSDESIATANLENGNVKINGVAIGTATITISYNADIACTKTIAATITCGCGNIEISEEPVTVAVGSYVDVNVIKENCIDNIEVESTQEDRATASYSNGKIRITGIQQGGSTIEVSYNANGTQCYDTKTIIVTVTNS